MGAHTVKKDFSDWMELKHLIQHLSKRPRGYAQREIWWTSIGMNLGFEEDGKGVKHSRPVLIVRGFSKELFWGIPLSTTRNRGTYYHAFKIRGKTSVALLSQMRTFDTVRLRTRYGMVSEREFNTIKAKMHAILD